MRTQEREMLVSDVMSLSSGDYPGELVSEVYPYMTNTYCCHEGSCQSYIQELRDDMLVNGYDGYGVHIGIGGTTLTNGHHRTWAAHLAGLTHIPTIADPLYVNP